MKKLKTVLILLLLFSVTAFMVFFPQIINIYNEKRILEKTDYWSYDNRAGVSLTSKQVAKLFSLPEISVMTYVGYNAINDAEYTADGISTDINFLFDTVFGKDEAVCNYVKSIMRNGNPSCTREYVLTVADDRPVVLNLMTVSYKDGFDCVDFTYEEKTKTLLSFNYCAYSPTLETKYDSNSYELPILIDKMDSVVNSYCKNELGLNDNEFYFENYISDTYLASETFVGFAIARSKTEIDAIDEKEIQY